MDNFDDMFGFVFSLIILLAFIGAMDVIEFFWARKNWIDNGGVVKRFPSWQGTNKPVKWFVSWHVIEYICDFVFVLTFPLVLLDKIGLIIIVYTIPGWLVLKFFEMIIYVIIECIVIDIIRRKNKRNN